MDTTPQTPQVLDEVRLSEHLRERLERVEELHRQLGAVRAEFRLEKQQHRNGLAEQIRQADLLTREAAGIRNENASEKMRLLKLRKRLIVRWKAHWSTQRLQIDTERRELLHGYDDLAHEKILYLTERRKLTDALAVEKETFVGRRDEFAEEILKERRILDERSRQLDRRRDKFDADNAALVGREKGLRQQQKLAVQLRDEAEGLEVRISRHRKLLDRMESDRSTQFASIPLRPPASPFPLMLHTPDAGDISPEILQRETRRLTLVEAELSDQRTTLSETAQLLDGVQTKIHEEQERLADELLGLAQQIDSREAELENRDRRQAQEDRRIEDDRRGIRQDRIQIEASRAKRTVDESTMVAERDRQRGEIEARLSAIGQHRERLAEIALTWLAQRRDESERLRLRLKELGQLGQKWSEYIQGDAARLTAQHEREQRMLEREAAMHSVQLEILAEIESPIVLEKKLERQHRRIVQQYGRRSEQMVDLRETLRSEMTILRQLLQELPSAIPSTGLTIPELPTLKLVGEPSVTSALAVGYRRQIAVLREELDRLTKLGDAEEVRPEQMNRAA